MARTAITFAFHSGVEVAGACELRDHADGVRATTCPTQAAVNPLPEPVAPASVDTGNVVNRAPLDGGLDMAACRRSRTIRRHHRRRRQVTESDARGPSRTSSPHHSHKGQ